MKHRSLIIFIIVVAVLAFVPQAAEQFVEFRRTTTERALRGVSNAFLNLYAQNLRSGETPAATLPSPVSGETRTEVCSHTNADESRTVVARAASTSREKDANVDENMHQRRSLTATDETDVLLAANRAQPFDVQQFDVPLESHHDAKSLPRVSTKVSVATQALPQLAAVGKDFKSEDFIHVFQMFEKQRAAAPAPELTHIEQDALMRMAREAGREARAEERKREREVRLMMLESSSKTPAGHRGYVRQQGNWRTLKAPGSASSPAPEPPAPQPLPPVEVHAGF
ncbi:MAG TPA: hypothetical protein VF666_08395 [Pyrinomonadaceae bacterium]|jgi:hypothetical protein